MLRPDGIAGALSVSRPRRFFLNYPSECRTTNFLFVPRRIFDTAHTIPNYEMEAQLSNRAHWGSFYSKKFASLRPLFDGVFNGFRNGLTR